MDEAIGSAAEILKGAKRPLLYGWSNSTLEAQKVGIELARKLNATIDDTSSFCQGILMERVLKGRVPDLHPRRRQELRRYLGLLGS